MKKILSLILALCAFSLTTLAQTNQAPAFPGAEGHGRYTTGGRGGKIVHVTNLNNSGTGSLREAVKGNSLKTVVFDVAGVIELAADLTIGDNTTILGQTAPGDGITIRYYTVRPGGNNIIRFLRFRRGEEKNLNDGADAIWQREKKNIILDHCSFSWSIDEVASFYDNKDFTLQWCTVGEPLKYAGHEKGGHGFGGIWGGKGASFHHNLLIHLDNRAPRLNGARFFWKGPTGSEYPNVESCIAAEKVDFRNCVIYNTGTGNGAYGGMGGNHNIVNNYYKAGPATVNKTRVFQCSVTNSSDGTGTKDTNYPGGKWGKFYISGNYVTAASTPQNYDWNGVIIDKCKDSGVTTPTKEQLKIPEVETGYVTTHAAQTAYEKVLSYAGASKVKDCIDTRYEREVRNNSPECVGSATTYIENGQTKTVSSHPKGIIDHAADALKPHGGVYTLNSGTKPTDTDNDGIPDAWELANGLNPNDASDANGYDLDSKYFYTNIEVYANSLVQDIILQGNADAVSSVKEYFPAYKKEDGTAVSAIGENDSEDPDDKPIGGEATITWSLGDAESVNVFTATSSLFPYLKSVNVNLSDFFAWYTVKTQGGHELIEVGPNGKDASANPDHAVTFSYEIKDGDALFKPSKVEFYISKNGTDNGSFDVAWTDANGTSNILASGVNMIRNSVSPNYLDYSCTVSGVAPSKKGALVIMPYNIDGTAANPKKFGLGNVRITGSLSGGSSAIDNVTGSQEVTVDYFNLQGVKVSSDTKGVVLKVIRMTDGTKRVVKVMR